MITLTNITLSWTHALTTFWEGMTLIKLLISIDKLFVKLIKISIFLK